jgi:ubiquinone/menaquinone biosynthesis C-methylase UbiE
METAYIPFDRAASIYDATRGFPAGEERAVAALIAQAGNLRRESRVLEVGVGTGRIALPLTHHVDRLYGIDLSRPMMQQLRGKPNAGAIRLSEANALQLPFRRAAFDAVLIVHVLHLIADWQRVLREIARVLKPDGLLLCGSSAGDMLQNDQFAPIWSAWRAALPAQKIERIGLTQPVREALPPLGWRPVGAPQQHRYTVQRTPSGAYRAIEERQFSDTWRLSDAELQHSLRAVREAIAAHFPQPDQPIALHVTFEVQIFQPLQAT